VIVTFNVPSEVLSHSSAYREREGQHHWGRIRVNFAEPIVPRLFYQGKSRCRSSPIHDFMVTDGFALV